MYTSAILLGCLLTLAPPTAVLETSSRTLDVSVAADGVIRVLHKPTGRRYQTLEPAAPPSIVIPKLSHGDGSDCADLKLDSSMLGDQRQVDGDADCSALLRLAWDETALHVWALVTDDYLDLPKAPEQQWWEDDSVELWVGQTQIGFSLSPNGALATTVRSVAPGVNVSAFPVDPTALDGADWVFGMTPRACCQPGSSLKPGGQGPYGVHATLAWSGLPNTPTPAVGAQLRFAFGVNDADATGAREGQLYFPTTWTHSQPQSFALATLADAGGKIPAALQQPRTTTVSQLRRTPGGLSFQRQIWLSRAAPVQAEVNVTTTEADDSLVITLDLPDRDVPFDNLAYPAPLAAELPDGRVCFAAYYDGLLLPQTDPYLNNKTLWGGSVDLPFVGVSSAAKGDGYLLLLDTPFDAGIKLVKVKGEDGTERFWPQAVWNGQKGKFAETRRMRLIFNDAGGYVAQAKAYREVARQQGLLSTLADKAKKIPNVLRLAGAPNVWGGDLRWARDAQARGIEHCLLNYTGSAEAQQQANDLGYLTSRYDNYADLLEENDPAKWTNNHGSLDEVVRRANGELMTAWLTYDKKVQYLKRCGAEMLPAAQRYIPGDLAKHSYLGRFLDVTTASSTYECYDEDHPETKEDEVQNRLKLFKYVQNLGLVTGGEHGRFWAVPTMDYFEGMMSGGHYNWPAGHLRLPDDNQVSEAYYTYGVGGVYRIPLWELVFGDCVVDYWYWGDTTGYLYRIDPKISDRKDALNVLYGTPPMYWVNRGDLGFTWSQPELRERLLQSYRNTCRWHAEVMTSEMVSHEALTPDRLVQRSTFAGGREAVANLADEPREVKVGGQTYTLPPNGFVAMGPEFKLERVLDDGRVVSRIRSPQYAFVDGAGQATSVPGLAAATPCTVYVESPERLRVCAGSAAATLNPRNLVEGWDLGATRVFRLDPAGQRERAVEVPLQNGKFQLPATEVVLELATGSETRPADLVIGADGLKLTPAAPAQGQPLQAAVTVRNAGGTAVKGGRVELLVDGQTAASAALNVPARGSQAITLRLDTAALDGRRTLRVAAMPAKGQAEQLTNNNAAEQIIDLAMNRALWPAQPLATAVVKAGEIALTNPVVSAERQLPATIDPGSLRVLDSNTGQAVPSQVEPGGTIVWLVPGTLAAGASRTFELVAQPKPATVKPAAGGFWREADREIVTPNYALSLADGVVRDLRLLTIPQPDQPIWQSSIYSCAQTGWSDEDGVLDSLEVVADGPVRTIVVAKRTLKQGLVVYLKQYTFEADGYQVATDAEPSVTGLHNRVYFKRPGTLVDSRGKTTLIDGQGNDEDKISGGAPDWVAVFCPEWALSMLPVEPAGGLTYWDAGSWGGLGYSGTSSRSNVAFRFHPGQPDASFAAAALARLRQPATVTWR